MTRYKFNHRYSSDALGTYGEGDVVELDDAHAELLERDSPGVVSKTTAAEKVADTGLHQERPDDNQTARGRDRQAAARYQDRMQRGQPVRAPITAEGEIYGDTDGDGDPARNAVMPPEAPQVEPAPEAVPPVGEPSATGEAKPKGKAKN